MESFDVSSAPPAPLSSPASNARFNETSRMFARLHRYQLLLRKHWWVVPLCVILVLIPVAVLTAKAPPSYASRARMWLNTRVNVLENKTYAEDTANYVGTQIELLQSSTMRERVIGRLQPDHKEWPLDEVRVNVKQMKQTAIFDLSTTGPEPASTTAFLNSLMDEYLAFKKKMREENSEVTLTSITDQRSRLEDDLKQGQEKLHAFLSTNNLVFLQEQGSSAGNYMATLNRQLSALRTEYQLLLMIEPEQVENIVNQPSESGLDKTNSPPALSPEVVSSIAGAQSEHYRAMQQVQILKSRREDLGHFLRPNHPKMVKLNEEISNQEKLLVMFRQQSYSQLANRRQTLKLQIQNLEANLSEWEAKALEASRKMADYERLRQEVLRTQSFYDRLLTVFQNVDVNKNLEQENFNILERASVAKLVRKTTERLLMGLAAGLFLGLGVLYIIEIFDDRFTSINELRNHLSELVLGQIPDLDGKETRGRLMLVQANDSRHVFVEAFRNLRSSLLFMLNEKKRPRTILITSSVPEEGKSTVAANLAVTLALGGAKVLLVDADLRRSSLHHLFDLPATPGFGEILGQEINAQKAILATRVPKLFFLPAGNSDINPGELFLSPSTDVFLREVYSQYDYILVDSAPILATDDTSSLAPKMDGVLFVVRGSFTSARMAREALGLLRQRQVQVMGMVFNRAMATATEYYYYYRYHEYYRKRPRGESKADKSAPVLLDKHDVENPPSLK